MFMIMLITYFENKVTSFIRNYEAGLWLQLKPMTYHTRLVRIGTQDYDTITTR